MPNHRIAYRLADDQTDPWTTVGDEVRRLGYQHVRHHITPTNPHPIFQSAGEVRSPGDPVRWGQHVCCGRLRGLRYRVGSGRQARASLATTGVDDRATRTGTHTQPESVHACTTTVVRLKGPLALGHGETPRVTGSRP